MAVKAAGVICVSPFGEVLLILRGYGGDHPGEWAFPGGHIEPGEAPMEAAFRELAEEVGHRRLKTLAYTLPEHGGFQPYMYASPRFTPRVNPVECLGWMWAPLHALPRPMHPDALEILRDARRYLSP